MRIGRAPAAARLLAPIHPPFGAPLAVRTKWFRHANQQCNVNARAERVPSPKNVVATRIS